MATEVSTYIDGLDSSRPGAAEPVAEGDDHLRLVKANLKATFVGETGDRWDEALTVGPVKINAMPGRVDAIEANGLTLDGVTVANPSGGQQVVTVEHQFALGLNLANAATITAMNALDTVSYSLFGLNISNEVEVGNAALDLRLRSLTDPVYHDGTADRKILTEANVVDADLPAEVAYTDGNETISGAWNFSTQPKATGAILSHNDAGESSGKIRIVTSAPTSGGADGDIWLVV